MPTLYVGLKNNWLTAKEVGDIVTNNSEKLDCDEKVIVNIFVNADDKATLLEILRKEAEMEENAGLRAWQL